MTDQASPSGPFDAVTTPAGVTTTCPQCGVTLDALTTACARCGAVITGGGHDGERAERVRQRLQAQIGDAYQLGALIGRGGMGIVFRAREVSLDREVALKVLAFDPLLNPEAFTRFEREARLAARLDHPHIVPIFAVGQGDGAAFYTMRFVRGGSLEALIADKGALAPDAAIRLLGEVAAALDYAHGQGIVHRDIKPANILLSEGGHAMVADFGIARAFAGDAVTSTSGSHTGVVGSPAYMAPEQWRGDKPDGRADQYALGVLAFELLSGLRPFRDVSMQELLRMHLNEQPPALDSVRQGLPPHVGQAIRRAMAKEPADRFPTVSAFVAALAGNGRAVVTPPAPPPRPERAVPASHRGRQWLGNALAAVLVLTALAVGVNELRKPADNAPSAAVPASDTLAERLARELEETRKIAIDAQRRAERAESLQRSDARARTPAASRAGHVAVAVHGGAPRLLIDGKESAPSTPAIIEVPPGRHVVRVEGVGRQYQPAQYVIDVGAGDTSRLTFADVRMVGRELSPVPPGQPVGPSAVYARPGYADSVKAAVRSAVDAAAPAKGLSGDGTQHPFRLPARIWQNMSPQEQEVLRTRWSRMSPEQQRRAVSAVHLRDSAAVRFQRRFTPPPKQAQPRQPPP
ncbi:MAG: serine/threonine protein kinase [Gemmatimonadetes bacterium]|nr:serine/threonine protein kinase [Gemmatimonadota bacterium]